VHPPSAGKDIAAYEMRFRRAGLPLLIEEYSATEDIFTRALPLLTLVFLVSVFGALNLEWSLLANIAAFLGGVAILIGTFGMLNVLRRRPFRSIPRKVGLPELTAFVLLPPFLPLIFGGQVESAGVTILQQLVVLAIVYLIVGVGLLSILRWAGARLFSQLGTSFRLLVRAIPLLLIFSLLIFLTTETWQVFATVPRPFLFLLLGLLIGVGVLFLAARLPTEVSELEDSAETAGPKLRRSQRVNVGLVLFVSQALQVLVVSLGVGLFFIVLGALAVGPELTRAWTGSPGNLLFDFGLFGHSVEVTEELLRVSGAIAAFSGVYYAISTLTDATYREEFLSEITKEMKETFAARADYLRLLLEGHRGDGEPSADPAD
jgi:hypothetical protein